MTPSLFPADPIDREALAALAARSIPRAELSRTHVSYAKSTDLFDLGYSISHWFDPFARSIVIECNPIRTGGRAVPWAAELLRVTFTGYADQAAFHQAIGARVVGPGRAFSPTKEQPR